MATLSTAPRRSPLLAVVPALAGAAVAVALGVYGRVHQPSGEALYIGPFADVLAVKSWVTTLVLLFALGQLVMALWMYGRLGFGPAPTWVPRAHRISGLVAVLISLPVAYQCLWSLGFQTYTPRVLVHSLLGCAFYGVFVAKVLNVQLKGLPSWMVPVAGGLLFTILVGIWLVTALWYFTQVQFPGW